MRIVDISVGIEPGLPIWPTSPGFTVTPLMSMAAGDVANVSRWDTDVHVGTHVDAPLHFCADGASVDQMPLETFVGPAWVAEVPAPTVIEAEDLARLELPDGITRLLLKTANSARWQQDAFDMDYVGLAPGAAEWVVERDLQLVGIDYLSIQKYEDPPDTHQILLRAGVAILEGVNLAHVKPGLYTLFCLPVKLVGTEGAPARAVLVEQD